MENKHIQILQKLADDNIKCMKHDFPKKLQIGLANSETNEIVFRMNINQYSHFSGADKKEYSRLYKELLNE